MSTKEVKQTRSRKGSKINMLDKFLASKEIQCNIGTVEIKESLSNAIQLFLENDKKLFERILTESLESVNIEELANEYRRKLRQLKKDENNLSEAGSSDSEESENNSAFSGHNSGI